MIGAQPRTRLIALAMLIVVTGSDRALLALDGTTQGPRVVLIIRHAEKPEGAEETKDPNLSKRGVQRARALAKVIPKLFPRPDFLIATLKSKRSNRPFETIEPLAKALHETIEATFEDNQVEQLARAVLTERKYAGKVVLIAWHHGELPELAKALGAADAPHKWDADVFDRVWEITYKEGVATFKDLPQKALPGDSEQ
jgi:phosphohistidine phosphatase SixA